MSKSRKRSDPECCVLDCKSSQQEKIIFFHFPKNLELASRWLKIIGRNDIKICKKTNSVPKKFMICCKHFEPNMLKPPLFNQLKDDAIPIAEQAETSKTQPKRVKQEMPLQEQKVDEEPEDNVIYNRYLFGIASQGEYESMLDFIDRLNMLASACNYKNMMDELIRDRLIIGIINQKLREILYSNSKLTLQEAIEFCELNDSVETIEKTGIKTEPGYEVKDESFQTIEYTIDTPRNEEMDEEYIDYNSQVGESEYELSDNSNIIEGESDEEAEVPKKKSKSFSRIKNISAGHKCHLCNSWFTAQRNFLVHINDEHSHISKCDDCFKTISSKYNFIQHSQECSLVLAGS